MRVLHLATTYPLHADDSNAAFVEALAEGLAERGHQIEVLLPWHPQLQLHRPGKRVRLHAFRYSPVSRWHPWGYAQALRADRQLRAGAYLAALPAAIAAGRFIRRHRKRFDLLHAHWLLPNAPVMALARGHKPMVMSCHGSGVFLAERYRWAARLASYALRSSTVVTGCSEDLVRRLRGLDAGPEPVRMPYGVALDRFRPVDPERRCALRQELAEEWGVPSNRAWILAVGRLVHKKGFEVLVDALPQLLQTGIDAQVLIIGAGPLRQALIARARAAGVGDRLHLAGAAPHQRLAGCYAAADVVAVPSVHGPHGNVDGLPNTLLEGLATGTAVVASRVAGIPDVVADGDNGILVPEGDSGALAAAIGRVLREPALGQRLGARARARAERELGWERVAERFERLYQRSLENGPR